MLTGAGRAHGAITVVNAIPAGLGAAIGVELATVATAELEDRAGPVRVVIEDAPDEDGGLGEAVLDVVGRHLDRPLSGTLTTRSDIPIAAGLKSSSTAANAMVLAALDALGEDPDADTVLALSVAAARRAGVSVTGALDDAAASLLGGLVVTDNREDRVVKRKPLAEAHHVLLLVPSRKRYTAEAADALAPLDALSRRCHGLAAAGRWPHALTVNGLGVAAALGEALEPTYEALGAGAMAAGLSGTGPAVAAVCDDEAKVAVARVWGGHAGRVLMTRTTDEGALA